MYKIFLTIFLLHMFAGFFLQSKRISKLKAEKIIYLFGHVGLYTLVFIVLSPILLGLSYEEGLVYSLINGVLHFIVDFITGKVKKKLSDFDTKRTLVVLLDYTLHLIILTTTYLFIYPNAMYRITFWDVA